MAYKEAQRLLRAGLPEHEILPEVKRVGAFGGNMRSNLIRMLKHFEFAKTLGIESEGQLWSDAARQLYATSVVPHAAFRNGKMFNGSFSEVQASPIFQKCFVEDFLTSITQVNSDALYIALGPTPHEALKWCAKQGVLRHEQILGAFAHPSGSAGSQIYYYLREKTLHDLDPKDPVRSRTRWLDEAYEGMLENTRRLRSSEWRASFRIPASQVEKKSVEERMLQSKLTTHQFLEFPRLTPRIGV